MDDAPGRADPRLRRPEGLAGGSMYSPSSSRAPRPLFVDNLFAAPCDVKDARVAPPGTPPACRPSSDE